MSKLTYLQIVQRVASAIDSDNVSTIDESPEAEQIALLVQTVYDDMITNFPWYHTRETVALEVTPTLNLMKLPNGVEQLMSKVIYYDNEPVYYKSPENMRRYLAGHVGSGDNIDSTGAQNDKDPDYWSSYDDEYIIFDSYDGNLVSAKTAVWVAKQPESPSVDEDVPDLPHNLHSTLLFGCLAEAFRTLKGDEVAARSYEGKYKKGIARAKRWARRTNIKENPGKNIDFGRKNGINTRAEISTSQINEG